MTAQFRVKGPTFDHRLIGGVEGGTLKMHDDGEVTIQGVDFGKNLRLHHTGGQWIVVKVPGQQWYLNQYQGMQYEPAKFLVFRMISVGGGEPGPKGEAFGEMEFLFEFYAKEAK